MRLSSTLSAPWLACALLLALGACTGGQSGTESGGGKFEDPWITLKAIDCGCALAGAGTAVRATLTSQDACGLRASVVEVLGRGPLAEGPALAEGDELGGAPLLPCAEGLALAEGDDLLLVHVPGPEATTACPERLGCEAGCPLPALGPDGGIDARAIDAYDRCAQRCGIDTAEACAEHAGYARLHGQLLVVPWAPLLQVSSAPDAGVSLPRDDLQLLVDPVACGPALYPEAAQSDVLAADAPSPAGALPSDDTSDGGVEAPRCGEL